MDGVGISIIERPRPLPGHDTPNPTEHPYTLKCEEPHKVNKTKYTTTAQCVKECNIEKITNKKHLAHNFPIQNYTIAVERAVAAWKQYRVNDIGPNPSSAMPWFIDLLVSQR